MALLEMLKALAVPLSTKKVAKHETLVEQGVVTEELYFIHQGALRMGHLTPDGKEVTVQFFFEGSQVSVIRSFIDRTPSQYFVEAIEDCQLIYVKRIDFIQAMDKNEQLKELVLQVLLGRMTNYSELFLSRIQYSPEERYRELQERYASVLHRVPDQYLASYLGITPVSFSRIKKRLT
ncbi:hypothetical protein CAC02_08175 [Streptococcus gallolyticus]|uniref:Cyclic nucleotide-binding domain-containing protein n=1 Tax=Streptococcus gallolyticus TaxID=315405 RepID=A0A368UD03_9STRE|nr:Crp/Fnr family transcriptional regulator [Streptococcus gallolyticus]RCW16507.1 hypothetical protein CAC02_08175 [Streptococcus gallolyticus]